MTSSYTSRADICNAYYSTNSISNHTNLIHKEYPSHIASKLYDVSITHPNYHLNWMMSESDFIVYIQDNYVDSGQTIKNINVLYYKLSNLDFTFKWKIYELIDINTQKKIQKNIKLNKYELMLMDFISETIYINNGHPSELWFAILFNGKVCSSLNNSDGIESDVIKDNCKFSLKCYSRLTSFDFGALSKEFCDYLKNFTTISSIITGLSITKSYGRTSFNSILKKLKTRKIKSHLKELVECSDKNEIVKNFIEAVDNLRVKKKSIETSFYYMLNRALDSKLNTVDYWVLICKDTMLIYTSNDIFNCLKCKDTIKNSIVEFKEFKLRINALRLEDGV